MKMNSRDKTILIGLLTFIIVIAGIFGLIRPKINDVKADEVTLNKTKAEWEELEAKIKEIKPLQDEIKKTYEDSKKVSAEFMNFDVFDDEEGFFKTFKLDQYMQPIIDECELEVITEDLGSLTTKTLGYYYVEPEVVSTSMLDLADVNGNYQAAVDEKLAASNALSERTQEELKTIQYGFKAKGTRENIWTFMKKIKDLKITGLIDSVNIDDYTFGEDDPLNIGPDANKSEVTFVISFYSVYEMDEPVVD